MDRVFLGLLKRAKLPAPVGELRFHPTRKWRWDYAWPAARLALEVQGGVWARGKHGRGTGIVKDHAKYNAGACLGWRVLQVQPAALRSLDTVALVRAALQGPTDSPLGHVSDSATASGKDCRV